MKLGYKYFIATAFLLFVLTGMAFAQSNPFIKISVESFDGYVRVGWTIKSEAGIDHYEVWRSSGTSDPILVGVVQHGVYSLDDKTSLYKTEDQYFSYQVKALGGPNGPVQGQSEIMGIRYSNPSSTAKRTWGSIKAMFR
jgi:hypothetical protein